MCIRITHRILGLTLFFGVLAFGPQTVFAQGSSLFNSSGVSKSGTGGISGSLGASGFGSMTGGSGASGGALGSALGALGGNRTGAAGGTGFGATGGAGAGGLNGSAGAGFVGRTNTAMAGNARAGQAAGNSGGARGGSRGTGGASNNQTQNPNDFANGGPKKSSIRPRQRVAFDFNPKTAAKVASTVSTRLDRISLKNPALKQVGVQVVGDQLVLSGKVKNVEQSRLAENLLRLEPGVKSIRNELEIEQTPVVE
ncbi:MAG: transport-associated protein [Planctomycetaceae bacterium]|nr:transport-associated protein [Planctomycetaceae bacterium]